MRLHPRSKVGVAVTLFVFLVAISAEATIVDDLINVINTVNDLLGHAKNMAKTTAQDTYNNLDSALRTANNSVTNTAAIAGQSVLDNRNNINKIIDDSIVIYPGDLAGPLQGILDCVAGTKTALTDTDNIAIVANAAKQIIRAELDAARLAAPRLSNAATAIKATEAAATEAEFLSQRVVAWTAALQKMRQECGNVATAIRDGRFKDLPEKQQILEQTRTAYQTAWNQLQAQATKTQAAFNQARLAVQAAKSGASAMASHLQNALDQVGGILGKVRTTLVDSNAGYNTCISAVNAYVDQWNQVVANARQRFLDSLTPAQREAIENLNQSVSRAEALVGSIRVTVSAALVAAQSVVNAAESSIASAVSGMITSFVNFLKGFLTHVWDLDMTQVQKDLNTLTTNIAAEVARIANAVMAAANPKKTEAENHLAALTGIAQQMSQLYQQLYQVTSMMNIALRAGSTLVQPKTFLSTTLKTSAVSTTSIQTSTSTRLNSILTPYIQTLSKSVYNERLARKLPVL